MLTVAGSKHLSFHLLLHGPPPLHLSTEKLRVQSVRDGDPSGYSRSDTIYNNINKNQKNSPIEEVTIEKFMKCIK